MSAIVIMMVIFVLFKRFGLQVVFFCLAGTYLFIFQALSMQLSKEYSVLVSQAAATRNKRCVSLV